MLALAACDSSDGPIDHQIAVRLEITADQTEIEEGESLTLRAVLYDPSDRPIDDPEARYVFHWHIDEPELVDASGSGAELTLRFREPGETTVSVTASRTWTPPALLGPSMSANAGPGLRGNASIRARSKPSGIIKVEGDGQRGPVNSTLPEQIVVRVIDRIGQGVAGHSVTFTVRSGGGSVDPVRVNTDEHGYARAIWTLGPAAGRQVLRAAAAPNVGNTEFEAEALLSAPAAIRIVDGSGQSAHVGEVLPSPVVAEVTDASGNPMPGIAVEWRVVSGGGSITALAGATDASGRTSATWKLGPVEGTQRAEAAVGDLRARVTATAVARDDSSGGTLVISPRTATLDAIGATVQLEAVVKNSSGAPVSTQVSWSSSAPGIATVDGSGKVTAKSVGTALIIAAASALADTAVVTVRQVPASVELGSSSLRLEVGDDARLTAVVKDAGGTVIPKPSITWSSSAPSIATVDSDGRVVAVAAGAATITARSGPASASATVTVEKPNDPPPPPPPSQGIWLSANEIAALPMSGAAWNNVKSAADRACGTPDLSDQEDPANVCVMAKALVYARIGGAAYRDGVLSAIRSIVGSRTYSGRALALGRELAAYVIAADLIGLATLDPALDASFRAKLRELRTTATSSGPSNLVECYEVRPNNWGLHCGASLAAVAVYLDDRAALDRIATVFRGWLGDRSAYAGFKYGSDLSWQADPARPVGINPRGATRNGANIDGVLPEEMRRCGSFQWPPCSTGYTWEALQGAVALATILHRQGYPTFEWSDRAILRAVTWLYDVARAPAEGDDTWQPHIINRIYGTNFPAPVPARPGKNVGWTDWTHGK